MERFFNALAKSAIAGTELMNLYRVKSTSLVNNLLKTIIDGTLERALESSVEKVLDRALGHKEISGETMDMVALVLVNIREQLNREGRNSMMDSEVEEAKGITDTQIKVYSLEMILIQLNQ